MEVPNIDKLVRITARKPDRSKRQRADAVITTWTDNTATLTVMSHHWEHDIVMQRRVNLKLTKYSRIEILHALAHELSHLRQNIFRSKVEREMYHTPAHAHFTHHLAAIFMLILKESGYVSEESEARTNGRRKA